MTVEDYIAIMEKQEETLQFSRFNRQDAWDLGHILAGIIRERELPAALCIRHISGSILFQWLPEGTNPDNEYWMIRKFRMVRDLERSSLLSKAIFKKNGDTLEARGLDPHLYAASGGGFPVKIKDSGLFAAAIISGLPERKDHGLLVEGISRHLGLSAPMLPDDFSL